MIGSFQVAGSLFPELNRLQQQLEEMLYPAGAVGIRSPARGTFPAVNVASTPDSVEVIAFLPGINPQEIDITVARGLLSLTGERRTESPQGQAGSATYAKERFTGKFHRVISLPEDADSGKVEAKYRDGVLQVTVTKRVSSKPRQITVSSIASPDRKE